MFGWEFNVWWNGNIFFWSKKKKMIERNISAQISKIAFSLTISWDEQNDWEHWESEYLTGQIKCDRLLDKVVNAGLRLFRTRVLVAE